MRKIFIVFLFLPFCVGAQKNRSANEFAKEKIQDYLSAKIFKDQPYHVVEYGQLVAHKIHNTATAWGVGYKVETTEWSKSANSIATTKQLNLFFYLDQKLNVLFTETYQRQ